ncbi:TIGR00159 family protein [bacterium]|nr:TIGR00159 family protein [bacterium]
MTFLVDIGFLPVRFLDLLDITLVALMLYVLYKLVRGTIAFNISIGIASIFFIWWLVRALEMRLVAGILGQFIEVGVIAVLIVFQQEIRRVLLIIGRNTIRAQAGSNWRSLLPWNWDLKENFTLNLDEVVKAARQLSATQTGALMVISRSSDLKNFTNTGVEIRSLVKSEILITIFQKTGPLHDGAVIIAANMLVAASCILPVSQAPGLPRQYGTRHRAALGLTEQTDAVCVVVSEENGGISYAVNGKIHSNISSDELMESLNKIFKKK